MLHLRFVFSYEAFGQRSKSSVMLPSTFTWDQAKVQAMNCEWQSDFRAIRREWETCVWPGGYPIYYVVKDGGVLCPRCANQELHRTLDKDDDQFFIVGQEANYEDPELYCDHCNERIPSAYVEDDRKEHIALLEKVYAAGSPYDKDNPERAKAQAELDAWVACHPCFQGT